MDATHFNIPDAQGLSLEGAGQQAYAAWASVNYVGGLGQYKQDLGQAIIGTMSSGGYSFVYSDNSASGALSLSGSVTNVYGGTTAAARPNTVNFNSANSPSARTGLITAGPRLGINYMIRVL